MANAFRALPLLIVAAAACASKPPPPGTPGTPHGKLVASLSVKVPVWQHFIETSHAHGSDPGQLTYPGIVNLAVHTSFGGPQRDVAPRPRAL